PPRAGRGPRRSAMGQAPRPRRAGADPPDDDPRQGPDVRRVWEERRVTSLGTGAQTSARAPVLLLLLHRFAGPLRLLVKTEDLGIEQVFDIAVPLFDVLVQVVNALEHFGRGDGQVRPDHLTPLIEKGLGRGACRIER